jgi:hypothetical protein
MAGNFAAADAPQTSQPLACVPADRHDPAPWTWNSRILSSFPPDRPKPEFAGAFGDDSSQHELHLWRDSNGIFGELLSPVLDADSPTSRLYAPRLEPRAGRLSFAVRFEDGERRFTGALRSDAVTGVLQRAARTETETVTWRKLPPDSVHGVADDFYTSRAQFDCAMILFHRQ